MEARSCWRDLRLPAVAGRVLEHLISRPESTVETVADELGLAAATVGRALRLLERELLVLRVTQRPTRWSANPPRTAIQALVERRRAELARIELHAERLQEEYTERMDRRFASDQFEILDTPYRVTERYEYLLRSAHDEILHLAMPPYVASTGGGARRLGVQRHLAARGVRFRSVYDAGTFDDEHSLRTAREGVGFGAVIRLGGALPMKLVLFDRGAAIMALSPENPAGGSLAVYSPPLLRVLRALFEQLWERAEPWSADGVPVAEPPPQAGLDPRSAQVLRLMALGMKDDAIARAIDVSRRTVQQVISNVGARLGARTRFQIALHAQTLGWVGPETPAPLDPAPPPGPGDAR